MIAEARPLLRVVLYEGSGATPLAAETRFEVQKTLLERGYAISVAREGSQLSNLGHRHLVVLGAFESGAPEFDSNGTEVHALDVTDLSAEDVLERVAAIGEETGHATADGWKPWFPVIDYDRCTNCMQCLSFCLFGVYGVSPGGEIQVQNENNCKTDCPACSRVCPEVAILFPKYKAGPINGDVVSEDDVRREAMKVDISSLLGGDIYAMLRDRSEKAKSRFSRERDDERALKERQRCLTKLQKQMGDLEIPPEVLGSLPSADQIQSKAAEAKRRADDALSASPPATD